MNKSSQLNIYGSELELCSENPLTGYFRDGFWHTCSEDRGCHSVCVKVTEEFLKFSLNRGNDLITPVPEYDFPGLKPGDRWCVCALRWKEALNEGAAAPLFLRATHEATLKYITRSLLEEHGVDDFEE